MPAKSAKITLNPSNQNLDAINRIVANIIGKSGCNTCGRLINMEFQFQGDPAPDLAKEGIISVQTEGF
jgi:hypothetical protein